MRPPVDIPKLELFMRSLASRVKGKGCIYLTGGATALLHGWRPMTVDIDLCADPEPQGFFEAIASLKDELSVNVELARPSDFIPELPFWRDRSPFIEKYKEISFHHYDPYSQALSKIERGHARDETDVASMVAVGLVKTDRLIELFEQIKPLLIRYPAIDRASFEVSVARFLQHNAAS